MKKIVLAFVVAFALSIGVVGADSTVAILDSQWNQVGTGVLSVYNPAGCETLGRGQTTYYEFDHDYTWWVCNGGEFTILVSGQ